MADRSITILGDGAMATVCATLLDGTSNRVTMWGPFPDHVEQMIQTRRNERYLPGYPLPPSLRLTSDATAATEGADLLVAAVPTPYIRQVWQRFAPRVESGTPVVSVAKGIENETLLRPTQIIQDVLGERSDDGSRPIAALSGPSIASELARCLPATVGVASENRAFTQDLQQLFTTNWLRVYTNSDLLGVEIAGATKNVIALAAGVLDGLQAGNNAKSALLSRGLAEIARLAVAMGAEAETLFGVTGVGDLAVTCFSPQGRNRTAGEMLGKGRKLDEVLQSIEGVVEGVPTTKAVLALAERHGVEMPITSAVYAVLFDNLDPIDAISMLMQRAPKEERVR